MKRKIASMIIIASMVFMLLPQTAVFAEIEATGIDAAIKEAGGIADKGNIYVSGDCLPQSVEIEGAEYPLIYLADRSDVIDSSGAVQHGMKPVYVKVTPQILSGGQTVSGSEQALIILPKNSLIKGEFFEDFEGGAYAPGDEESVKTLESNTTYGKFTTGTISSNACITVKNDNTRYLEVRTNSGSTASGIVAPKVTAALSADAFSTGTTVLSMRAMVYIGGSASTIALNPISVFYSSSATNKQYYLYAHKDYATTTNTITIPNNSWHNYLFIRKNGKTPEETTTEVFYDGESIGSYTGERGSLTEFAIEVARAKSGFIYADDIMVFGLEETIVPDIKLTDKGNMYVSGNQLPESVSIEGTDYPITYISDNEAVISASGAVTHQKGFSYVTVTPTVSIMGEQVLGKAQKLLVLPEVYDTLFDEDFEGFSEGTIERNATTNGWNSNAYTGAEHIVQEIRKDENHGNYLYFGTENPSDMGATNPVLKKAFDAGTGYEGTTLVGMRMLAVPYTASNGISTTFAQFNSDNIKGGNSTSISNNTYTKKWHNFLFEINNEDTVSEDGKLFKKAKLYIDGEYIDAFYTQNWSDEMKFTLYRGNDQYAMIDDIFVINLTGMIVKLPEVDNIPLANIGGSYVDRNLPRTVTIEGTEYEITYETTNPDVINEQGEIVQKDYEYGFSTVTPVVTIDVGGESIRVRGVRTGLGVLPKEATTTIFDDFEGAYIGQNLAMLQTAANRYNTWYGNAQAGNEKVRAVIEEENVTNNKKNKYFALDVDTPGGSTNPVIKLEKEHKDIAGTITATSLKVKYRSDLCVHISGLGYIRSNRIDNSSFKAMLSYSNTTMKANEWYNITLIKNAITLKIQVYINGIYQGEYTYSSASEGDFEFFVYRNISQDSCIDDLLVQRITDMGHLEATRDAIDLGDTSNVTENITLPQSADGNVAISWEADCEESVAQIIDGTLFIKRSETGDRGFVLKATLLCNGTAIEREFNITVKMIRPIELAALSFEQISDGQRENAVMQNLSLPNNCDSGAVSITWSSLSGNVSDSGVITRNILDKQASIKAVYTGYGDSFEKIYTFVIRGTGKILYEGSFDSAAGEGASVDSLNGWKIGGTEDKHQDKSVDSVIVKDPRDALLSFEDARKVLKVHRFATKNDRAVSNDKAMLTFDEKIKPERTAYDFDFCINDGRILVELFDMQMTFAITRTGVAQYGFDNRMLTFDNPLSVGKWYHATIVQDGYLGKYDFYLDYEYVGSEAAKGAKGIKGINFYSNAVSSTSYDTFFIANILVKDVTPSPGAAVEAGIRALTLGEIDYEKAKITLPDYSSENTYVEWKSSKPEIISDNGVVNRTQNTETVTLTATVSKGTYKEEKTFDVAVNALTMPTTPTAEIMSVIADDLTFDLISDESHLKITKDLNLITSLDFGKAREIGGVTISWESDTPYTITNDGKYREAKYEKAVKLTATITCVSDPNVKVTKEFLVVPQVKAVIHQYWDFEDCTAETVGETVQEWTTLERRAFTSETEYGLRQYVDKEPGQEHLPLDKANKVLYLDRVVNKNLASVPSLDYLNYAVATEEEKQEIEKAGNAIICFKLMLSNKSTSLPITLYCMTEQTISLSGKSFYRRRPTPDHTASFKTPMEENIWYEVTMFFDLVSHRMDVYVDGVRANDDPFDVPWGHSQLRSIRIFNDSMDPVYLDDFSIRYLTPQTGENAASSDAAKLTISQTATEDIALPVTGEMGSSIYWESSDSNVITSGGKIFPSSVSNLSATLTASICYENVVEKREFNITVPKNTSVPYEITSIDVENNMLKSVSVRENSATADAQLLVMIYDKERLIGVKTFDNASGEILLNYDLSALKNYRVTAFVWNRTKVLSNKKSINWGGGSK